MDGLYSCIDYLEMFSSSPEFIGFPRLPISTKIVRSAQILLNRDEIRSFISIAGIYFIWVVLRDGYTGSGIVHYVEKRFKVFQHPPIPFLSLPATVSHSYESPSLFIVGERLGSAVNG